MNAVILRPHDLVRLDGPTVDADETGVHAWNLHERVQGYHYCCSDANGVRYSRNAGYFPQDADAIDVRATTTPGDTHARMARDWRERTVLVFQRGADGSVRTLESDDDGETWGGLVTLWVSGRFPTIGYDPIGKTLFAAAWIDTGSGTSGNIQIRRQGPGDLDFQAAFTALGADGMPLVIGAGSFHISAAPDTQNAWVLIAKSPAGAILHWRSYDDGETWEA